ncbi:MAG TPA: DUF998 domain-containing protein [Candidatus Saccharimonadales bacterium]|jgi:glycerol uptake facilitator-like aquaporin|nr:DUF998 domain-containing protein [Candidatus Saccharimonadales bacterium]
MVYTPTRRQVAVWCGSAAIIALLFNNWLLQPLLNPALSLNHAVISEISARTQPYHWVFQTLDIAAGALTLLCLPYMLRFARQVKLPLYGLLVGMVALLGIDSILDASLAISCAPTIDLHCSLTNSHSLITEAHMVESTTTGLATLVAPVVWWWACRQRGVRLLAQMSVWFVGLQALVGLSILGSRAIGVDIVGTAQRLYELGVGAWIGAIGGLSTASRVLSVRRPIPNETLAPETE